MNLHPFLEEIRTQPSPLKAVACGRRVGGSSLICEDALWKAIAYEGYRGLIWAPYQDQAKLLAEKFDRMLEDSPGITKTTVVRRVKYPSPVIEFSNGSRVHFRAGENSACGETCHGVWIDQIDGFRQPKKVVEAAVCCLSEQGHYDPSGYTFCRVSLMVVGTPFRRAQKCKRKGRPSWFATLQQAMAKGPTNWRLWQIPSSLSPHWTPEIEEYMRRVYSKETFEQEFEAQIL